MRILLIFLLLYAADVWSSTTVTFAWDASATATGYKIYCGNAVDPVSYATPSDVGNVTQADIVLADNQGYYCAVTAYNGTGESGSSSQVQLVAPPSFRIIGESTFLTTRIGTIS